LLDRDAGLVQKCTSTEQSTKASGLMTSHMDRVLKNNLTAVCTPDSSPTAVRLALANLPPSISQNTRASSSKADSRARAV
jgi:hypothetical protein